MKKNVMEDSGIKRGDRADTGDEQVGHEDGVGRSGSGVPGGDGGSTGHVTGSSDALAEPVSGDWIERADVLGAAEDLEDFTITDAGDPNLGLTGVAGHPPEDWAANTGPTVNPDAEELEVVPPPEEPRPRKRK